MVRQFYKGINLFILSETLYFCKFGKKSTFPVKTFRILYHFEVVFGTRIFCTILQNVEQELNHFNKQTVFSIGYQLLLTKEECKLSNKINMIKVTVFGTT